MFFWDVGAIVIRFVCNEKIITAPNDPNKLLSEIASDQGLFLNMRCGGEGSCGGCAIALTSGKFITNKKEIDINNNCSRSALACKTRVLSEDAEISIPRTALIELSGNIDQDFLLKPYVADTQTKKFVIELGENDCDHYVSKRDHFNELLNQKLKMRNIYLPLDMLQKLPYTLSENNKIITVTIGRIRSYWFVINIEAGDTLNTHLAVAFDIGTTSVVGVLINLINGSIIAKASRYNQQVIKADDVASRISYASTRAKVIELQRLVIQDTINPIINELCLLTNNIPEHINRMAASGNTIMTHLFLGISPQSIGVIPFQPVTCEPGEYLAKDLGVQINPNGIIDLVPCISGYIGGDITSDIYISQLEKSSKTTLMVDIGTNGEMIFSFDQKLFACATPAGPAFEGSGVRYGCRAIAGAIDNIKIDADAGITYTVIGGGKAKGVCGSAMIDFIAEAFRIGLLNSNGRFNLKMLNEKNLYVDAPTCSGGSSIACVLANKTKTLFGEEIYISEQDISQLLQAKAAIYSGLKTLVLSQGKTFKDVDHFILAGGFAKHINLKNAICMGMLPDLPLELFEIIGNGSLAGAFLSLVAPKALDEMRQICKLPTIVELNLDPSFNDHFVDALALPNMDLEDFPSVFIK